MVQKGLDFAPDGLGVPSPGTYTSKKKKKRGEGDRDASTVFSGGGARIAALDETRAVKRSTMPKITRETSTTERKPISYQAAEKDQENLRLLSSVRTWGISQQAR